MTESKHKQKDNNYYMEPFHYQTKDQIPYTCLQIFLCRNQLFVNVCFEINIFRPIFTC